MMVIAVFSCHAALYDWRLATRRGIGRAWDDDAAALACTLLKGFAEYADEIRHVTADAVRWLASAYRHIGARCAALRHSRFEEGSEHSFAYAYEHRTGRRPLHGEIVALGVLAMSTLPQNDPAFVRDVIIASGIAAHPFDVGTSRDDFVATLHDVARYVAAEKLDYSCINEKGDAVDAAALWDAASDLPRIPFHA
jgi:glycerol dehydrogenase-like iron-containing ADH family enzyme